MCIFLVTVFGQCKCTGDTSGYRRGIAPSVGTNPGSGANGASPYGVNVGSGAGGKRLQILYTAAQINAALTVAALPTGVPYVISTASWDVSSSVGGSASKNQAGTTIKMANTAATSLAFGSPLSGLTTVFGPTAVTFPNSTGYVVTNTLATTFTWDGTSNLVVEYCYTFSGVGLITTYGGCRRTNTGVVQMIYNGGAAVNCGSSFVTNVQAIPNVRLTVASACAQPSPIASNMSFSGLGTANVTVNWANGGGASRVVVAHATTAVSAGPATGIDYTAGANSIFGSGTNLGSSNFVVYAGTGSSVNVTGLTGGTTYFFSVYEGSATFCYSGGLSGSQAIPACLSYPNTDASSMTFSNILNNALTLSFTRGNGSNVMVVARLTATARVAPTFNTSYTPNTIFGSGNTTGAGNFVVLNGTANTVSVTGLANFTAYTFDVYEYNASPNCYSPSPLIAGISTLDGTTSGGCSASVVRSTAAGQFTAVTPSTYLTITGAMNSNYTANPIGFNFVYNGVTYTSFGLNTNGYIWFGTGSPLATATNPISNASTNLGGSGTIDGIISALGTFLTSSCVYPTIAPSRSEIGYLITGVAPNRILTIQWRGYAAATSNCGGLCELFNPQDLSRLDFQIKLNEDGGANSDKIVLAYWDQNPICIDAAAFSAQVGLRGSSNATFTNRTGGGNSSWALNAGVVNTDVCSNGASNFISGNVSLTFTQAITTGPTVNGFASGGSASNVCPATTVLLTAGSGFTSYQWFFNGSIIAGPGSNSSTYTAAATGAYTVVGKNGTCYAQSNAFSVTINSCGVAPVITTCGSSAPQANDPGLCSAVVNYTAATASGTPTPTITYSQNSGTSFPVGTTTVTVTASNGISPDATCSFNVIVFDNENPIAHCPANII
ncbi:MAG: HYR domain-containing protein [Bacteroidetes bacterium]|nr:HYR domain-containing protein [Bacteroidota bacterium]